AANPAQVDVHRADRTPAHRDAGGGAIVGDGIDDLARILQTRVDDLHRRHHIFGGAQYVGETGAGALQTFAHDEGEFDFHARLAIIGVLHLGAVGNDLVVQNVTVIRLVDHRGDRK